MSRAGRRPATIADVAQRTMHELRYGPDDVTGSLASREAQPWASSRPIHELILRRGGTRRSLRHAGRLRGQGRPTKAPRGSPWRRTWGLRDAGALQIHGASWYSTDFPVERRYREAKVYQVWEGTSEIQRVVIARQVLKEYAG